jgi:hypothetical protein
LAKGNADRHATGFFYLDAHPSDKLPLKAKLEQVYTHWLRPIVMIDDFAAPGDPSYGYDDYGSAGVLTLEYIRPLLQRFRIACFFPRRSALLETGVRRGYIVLARAPGHIEAL